MPKLCSSSTQSARLCKTLDPFHLLSSLFYLLGADIKSKQVLRHNLRRLFPLLRKWRVSKRNLLLLCVLNFCMYVIVLGIGGWAMNRAIDHGFAIGPDLNLPARFSFFFPMGNAATGFFVTFSLLAGVVGAASAISGLNHIRCWTRESLPAAAMAATIAWTLTLLAMGFAWKEIAFHVRNARLRTMEAFVIILSVTQLLYIAAVHGVRR